MILVLLKWWTSTVIAGYILGSVLRFLFGVISSEQLRLLIIMWPLNVTVMMVLIYIKVKIDNL